MRSGKYIKITGADCMRKLLLAWMIAVTVCFCILPESKRTLDSLDAVTDTSLLTIGLITVIAFLISIIIGMKFETIKIERWLFAVIVSIMAVGSLITSFTYPYLMVLLLLCGICFVYAVCGCDLSFREQEEISDCKHIKTAVGFVVGLSCAFCVFVSSWLVCRVLTFSTSTYDFGIFSQMFYYLKETGLPFTTLERDGLLSHFNVHVSPIYYLMLPFYMLYPNPIILQILQAIIMTSAVIPLWMIARRHGFSPILSSLICLALFFYPAFAGSAAYDLHENVFLTPLIFWLLNSIECRHPGLTVLFADLLLMVKEDSAVYVAVIGLYVFLHGILREGEDSRWEKVSGAALFIGAVIWFTSAMHYLIKFGNGAMAFHYQNLMFSGSGRLSDIIICAVILPFKVLYESVDAEKIKFIAFMLIPLLVLPFITRKYERYILFIPLFLINLMPDYTYQHSIYFQYSFGTTAFLIYLSLLNLQDFKIRKKTREKIWKNGLLGGALIISIVLFAGTVGEKGVMYVSAYNNDVGRYAHIRKALSEIPDKASVASYGFYTTELSKRDILYDVCYCSEKHLLSSDYVVLDLQIPFGYEKYSKDQDQTNGLSGLVGILEKNDYAPANICEDKVIIYHRCTE